ncbi:hypothetical protein BGZ80_000929 [Entomortierella chlamydospora]|uniref:Uncharacterized protein n=1 Tax=Entomortierella chlamydospora TaxID=101097 RepID=A0A9P6MSJ9_9FUNG|nr:hypothetical protein BGZ79_009547 [Entomortierella chlamydospora]KAG0011123.1 hypothetical protein BGZ80_000929 [Entomortierella chlamydospora]
MDGVDAYAGSVCQSFRATDHPQLVRIPAVRHPSSGEYYIIWTDISDCFPRVARIQHDDVYVPFMRDQNLYRVRPHGIKYHPGVVLDVIYKDQLQVEQRQRPLTRQSHHFVKNGHNHVNNINASPLSNVALPKSSARVQTPDEPAFATKNGGEQGITELSDHSSSTPTSGRSLSRQSHDQYQNDSDVEPDQEQGDEVGLIEEVEEKDAKHAEEVEVKEAVLADETKEKEAVLTKEPKEEEGGVEGEGVEERRTGEGEVEGGGDKAREHDSDDWKDALGEVFRNFNQGIANTVQVIQEVERRVLTMIDTAESIKDTDTNVGGMGPSEGEVEPGQEEGTSIAAKNLREAASVVQQQLKELAAASSTTSTLLRTISGAPAPPGSTPALISPSDETLTIQNIARRRVSDILKRRYRWVEATSPKLFIILPVNYATFNKTESEFDDAYIRSLGWQDFTVHFLCDCGSIPGYESKFFPHLNLKDCPWGHPISKKMEGSIIMRFGQYMMAILEAFKYGVHLSDKDGDIIIPPEPDPEMQKCMTLAIKYLGSLTIASSSSFLPQQGKESDEEMTLDKIPAVEPLTKDDLASVKHFFSDSRNSMEGTPPILTPSGDVRWVCLDHGVAVSPRGEWQAAISFSKNPASTHSEFKASMGAFRSVVTTRERARDFYNLAEKLTTTCALRLFLDWDLSKEDEEELRQAVAKFPSACVKLQVRSPSKHSCNVPGFEHGYSAIIFEALKNPKIQAFILDHCLKDEAPFYGYDEWFEVKRKFMSHDSLARFKRSRTSDRMSLRILVTDIDTSATKIRRVVRGLHRFSKLSLIISDIWEYVTIKFQKPGEPGGDIVDTEYATGDIMDFFEKRGNLDSVNYNCRVKGDNRFIKCKMLTSLSLGYVYTRDRIKVREVLKNNKRLEKIELENMVQDDPSQIFETYKSLMANHPTLESFEIKQRHARCNSDFCWREVSDPAKMSVIITTFEGDRVASMFQKYATSLWHLNINGITVSDAAILEKVLRPKKGPFKLEDIVLSDVHLVDPAALEDLKKIVMRGDFKMVKVYSDVKRLNRDVPPYESSNSDFKGKTNPKMSEKTRIKLEQEAATKVVDFVVSIGSKITGIGIWGSSSQRMLEALESKGAQASILPSMSIVTVSGASKRLTEHKWLSQLLFYKSQPVRPVIKVYASIKSGSIGYSSTGGGGGGGGSDKNGNNDEELKPAIQKLESKWNEMASCIETPLLAPEFMSGLFEKSQEVEPIRELSIQDFEFQKEDLEYFLKAVDFSMLTSCQLDIINEMSGEALLSIAAAVPDNCMMESFTISVPGPSPQDSLLCQQWIKQKCSGGGERSCAVLVNGHL